MSRVVDPFTAVYEAVLSRLMAQPEIGDRIKPRNRTSFATSKQDPERRNPTTADYPECRLLVAGIAHLGWMSSTTAQARLSLAFVVNTGKLDISAELLPIQWGCFRAFASFDDNLGLSFVTNVETPPVTFAITEGGGQSPVRQWASVGAINVLMHHTRDALKGVG